MKRFVENDEPIKDIIKFIRNVRHVAYPCARENIRVLTRAIWRIAAESYLMEKGCYYDKEKAERLYLSNVVKLLHERELWLHTSFAHLIPALVRELKLDDFTFSPTRILSQLTAGLGITVESVSAIYERCYLQTLAGLLSAYRDCYGTSTSTVDAIQELADKLHSEKIWLMRLSKVVLDSTRTFEPEKLRCLIWIREIAVSDSFLSWDIKESFRERFVHELVDDAIALQEDLTDQYRAYCFKYLSRICRFMGQSHVDNRPSDIYAFMEALSVWLNDSGIIKELRNEGAALSSRCKSVMESLPAMFANVRGVLFHTKAVVNDFYKSSNSRERKKQEPTSWERQEGTFKHHQSGEFVNAELTEYILMEAKAFVVSASATCRESLIKAIPFIELEATDGGLRRKAKRIAELSLSRPLCELSVYMPDDEFYERFFDIMGRLDDFRVDIAVVWNAIASLLRVGESTRVLQVKAYDFVRRMEARGLMRYSYQTEALYYHGLANSGALLGVEGHDDWCCSFVGSVPCDRLLRGDYIRLAFRLRNRLNGGMNVAKQAVLELMRLHEDDVRLVDHEWRISTLCYTSDILENCLSVAELSDVKKFVAQAFRSYRPVDESLLWFMQSFSRLDVTKSIEVVRGVSGALGADIEFSTSVHTNEDKVDVAVKKGKRILLLGVLPNENYEVCGSVSDGCNGSALIVRDGVVSLGFVGMLQRVRKNDLLSGYDVHIGVVANTKTLSNIGKELKSLGVQGRDLHLLAYETLYEQMCKIVLGHPPESRGEDDDIDLELMINGIERTVFEGTKTDADKGSM